jgi:glucokinase
MMHAHALAVDLGGTKILAGVVDGNGTVRARARRATGPGREAQAIVAEIADACREAAGGAGLAVEACAGLGLGSPGPMDMSAGVLLNRNNLPTLYGVHIVDRLAAALGLSVHLNNDANCLGLAEARFGAGRGAKVCCGFTLGTGLGGFVVVDGRLHNGPRGAAAELWCSPYRGDFVEERVSGRGVARNYKKLSGRDADAEQVAERARSGDAEAREAWAEFGRDLAAPTAWMANVLDADVVVMGGSMARAWDLFAEPLAAETRKYVNPVTAGSLRVLRASCGDDAALLGAASLVFDPP